MASVGENMHASPILAAIKTKLCLSSKVRAGCLTVGTLARSVLVRSAESHSQISSTAQPLQEISSFRTSSRL
jgi:hypothetical protein